MKSFLDTYLIDILWIIGFNINNRNLNESKKSKAENYKNLITLI